MNWKLDRIPNPDPDYRAERCGHNFNPQECPYEFCGYRDTMNALVALVDSLKVKLNAPETPNAP